MASNSYASDAEVPLLLKSLSVDRKLSCTLLKEYASLRNTSITNTLVVSQNTIKEESIRERIESLLQDSANSVRTLESIAHTVDGRITMKYDLQLKDIVTCWKRDIALRIVLLNSMCLCDVLDMQRLLFLWLDSPYTHKLPFEND